MDLQEEGTLILLHQKLPHMMPAHTTPPPTHPATLPSTVQAAHTVEAKGAHAMSHTTLLRSKVNMGFLEQETQTWRKRQRHGARDTHPPSHLAICSASSKHSGGKGSPRHTTSHTTLLRSKLNMGFLEQETQTLTHTHTHTEVKSKEGGS